MPETHAPDSRRLQVSMEKEENVVYPPKKPTNRNKRNCGAYATYRLNSKAKRTPIKNDPLALTNSVPQGKFRPNNQYAALDNR